MTTRLHQTKDTGSCSAGHPIKRRVEWGVGGAAALVGAAAVTYAAYVGSTWLRYGHAEGRGAEETDRLLDVFMPSALPLPPK